MFLIATQVRKRFEKAITFCLVCYHNVVLEPKVAGPLGEEITEPHHRKREVVQSKVQPRLITQFSLRDRNAELIEATRSEFCTSAMITMCFNHNTHRDGQRRKTNTGGCGYSMVAVS